MARRFRRQHQDVFASEGDFNEQLYLALRNSPWWMMSLAIHVMVFFILTLFDTTDTIAEPEQRVDIRLVGEQLDIEPEDENDKPENKPVNPLMDPIPEPIKTDEPQDDVARVDIDEVNYDEPFGLDTGFSDAPFVGPNENGTIGTGGFAGGSFRGRGSDGDGTGGSPPGGKGFEEALDDALRWLAAHQSPNGGWEAAGFDRWCDTRPVQDLAKRPDGLGKALYDPGVSGLALCAFLGAGYTNRGKHPFAKVVSKGLRYLKSVQDPEGCFGPRSSQQYIYNHAIASLAMVEAFAMTGSGVWKGSAQRALDFIALARNPYFAWRYGIKPGDNDTSVTGWMMMALKSAKLANADMTRRGKPSPLVVDESAFDGIRTWLDKVTDQDYGRVGYVTRGTGPARPHDLVDRFPNEKSESMTAVGILARVFIGEDPRSSEIIKKGAALCAQLPPRWDAHDGSIDMYYWYYGTLAMFQVGGKPWDTWRKAMQKAIVESQRRDTDYCEYKGSWDPLGPWGLDGGRVYATAAMATCLEIYYRYPNVFGTRTR